MPKISSCLFSLLVVLGLSLAACSNQGPTPTAAINPTLPSTTSPGAPLNSPPASPAAQTLWIPAAVPAALAQTILNQSGWSKGDTQANSSCAVEASKRNSFGSWVYALVAPFDTVTDGVTLSALQAKWKGNGGDFPAQTLLLEQEDLDFLSAFLGQPAARVVQVASREQILEQAWKNKNTWAVIPFDQVQPEWKVLTLDGDSPLRKSFDESKYGLSIPLGLSCRDAQTHPAGLSAQVAISNRDPKALTTVVLTGVTAMVRGTAFEMEKQGLTYPARDIRDWLVDADFTHISNEISYWPNCPPPFTDNKENKLVFCSNPQYNKLLEDVHANVIELSGDHFIDYGPAATIYTLDMYKKLGWNYYGGGYNIDDARKPLLLEHNGNKIAFLGCNAKPPGYATASATTPGAVHCNFDIMVKQIKDVKAQGYLPIVTFQHLEYYSYTINPFLQADFERVADAGAVIVSGSQAHQPHGMEFRNGSFLHYGLGNLFFDQFKEGFPERQAFIDRHVFYKGKYINTELLSMMFTDLAHPRPMTDAERQDLLNTVFKVSIWPYQP